MSAVKKKYTLRNCALTDSTSTHIVLFTLF